MAILPLDDAAVARAAALIAEGQVVAVATETVYGLAADATRADAVARIYAAKGRPSFNPLIVHVLDLAAAERLAVADDDARALAAAFWPGPLTVVLPLRADAGLAPAVTAGLATVAIRVPAARAMRSLLVACGVPLAAPSANRSGAISPTTALHVAASLGDAVPLILDDGACPAGVESTIVAGRAVLRPGPVTAGSVAAVLDDASSPGLRLSLHPRVGGDGGAMPSWGRSTLSSGDVEPPPPPMRGWKEGSEDLERAGHRSEHGRVTAPGQLASHYAPTKPLRLDTVTAQPDEWLIGFGPVAGDDTLSATGDLTEAATNLFAALHRADASAKPRIAVAPVPAQGIGAAINDRLNRAAHR